MSRIRRYRTEAIVLKRHDYGEADRILTLFTPRRGKISAIAKGVRRITSRKGGHVELFTHAELLLHEGRSLDVLTQAETIEPFRALRDDLLRTTYAYHLAELVDRFVEDDDPNPDVFELLRGGLAALAGGDDPVLVTRFFELRLLGLVGYRPQLFHCVACEGDVTPSGNRFDPEAGGVVCPACAPAHPDALPLPEGAFRVLRFMQTHEWSAVRGVTLTADTRQALERVSHAYVRYLLERELKSVEFLNGLRQATQMLASAE